MYNHQKTKEAPALTLVLDGPADLYPEELPPGYTERCFKPGDESVWELIVREAYHRGDISYEKDARRDYAYRDDRVLFLCKNGEPIATAGAWYRAEWGRGTGYVLLPAILESHYSGLVFEYLLSVVLKKFTDEGKGKVIYQTDDFKVDEIERCLKLGFAPLLIHENQRGRWGAILPHVDTGGEIFVCDYGKPDRDCLARTKPRRKWYPEREYRCAGESVDALADESLYKPSQLGAAGAYPAQVRAGAVSQLKLWFTAGPAGIDEGANVSFCMRGQKTLGCGYQSHDPAREGYVEITTPPHTAVIDASYDKIGFTVREGRLAEGDTVEFIIDRGKGFKWTPLACRYEFKVVIDYGGGFRRRLPEPVVIEVLPLGLKKLEATVSCTRKPSGEVRINVTARDEYDNRYPYNGAVNIEANGVTAAAGMADGRAALSVAPADNADFRVKASLPDGSFSALSNVNTVCGGYQYYVGDLHSHDNNSEAHGYPDLSYKWAIEDRAMDFLSHSVQTHGWIDNAKWTLIKYMNERYHEDGRFVTLLANEWQHTGYGDKIIHYLGGDQPFMCVDDPRYDTAPKLYEALRASDAVVIGHHTAYPAGAWCPATDFDAVEDDVERLAEIWSMHGSSEGFETTGKELRNYDPAHSVMRALQKGRRLGFTGGSDTHSGRPGGSAKEPLPHWGGMTGIWASSLTRRDIFDALKNRRTVALSRERVIIGMTVNGAFIGSEAPYADMADIRIDVWAPTPIDKIQIVKNTMLLSEHRPGGVRVAINVQDATCGAAFYHCRVTLDNGDAAVCSPVWIG